MRRLSVTFFWQNVHLQRRHVGVDRTREESQESENKLLVRFRTHVCALPPRFFSAFCSISVSCFEGSLQLYDFCGSLSCSVLSRSLMSMTSRLASMNSIDELFQVNRVEGHMATFWPSLPGAFAAPARHEQAY